MIRLINALNDTREGLGRRGGARDRLPGFESSLRGDGENRKRDCALLFNGIEELSARELLEIAFIPVGQVLAIGKEKSFPQDMLISPKGRACDDAPLLRV